MYTCTSEYTYRHTYVKHSYIYIHIYTYIYIYIYIYMCCCLYICECRYAQWCGFDTFSHLCRERTQKLHVVIFCYFFFVFGIFVERAWNKSHGGWHCYHSRHWLVSFPSLFNQPTKPLSTLTPTDQQTTRTTQPNYLPITTCFTFCYDVCMWFHVMILVCVFMLWYLYVFSCLTVRSNPQQDKQAEDRSHRVGNVPSFLISFWHSIHII